MNDTIPCPDCEGGYVDVRIGWCRVTGEDTYGRRICETCNGFGEVANEFVGTITVECSICTTPTQVHEGDYPLCERCEALAVVHAKQEQSRRMWERDGAA